MGHRAGRLILAAWLLSAGGCGDTLVFVGDQPGTARVVAGRPGNPGEELGQLATESLLNSPHGVAVGSDATLYIADRENARVLAVSSAGAIDVLRDDGGTGQGPRLRTPTGLAVDGADLLIADAFGQRVWRLSLESGELTPIAGTGEPGFAPDTTNALQARLREPTGIAVTRDGRVYFSEAGAHRIRRVDNDGTLVTVAGTTQAGFSGDGGPAVEARLRTPRGLALSGEILYIADSGNHRIRRVDLTDLSIATVVGSGGVGFRGDGGPAREAWLNGPSAVSIDEDGAVLYLADTNNHRVRMVNLESRVISTLMGTGATEPNGDLLPAGETNINRPQGVAASLFGILFVADTENHAVWRTPVGIFDQR